MASASVRPRSAGLAHRAKLGASSFYEVQPDDTLDTIARRFGMSVERLVAANDWIMGDRLPVGRAVQVNGL